MIENKKPPVDFNTPIPNLMGSAEEVYYVDTPQGPAFLGDGLSIDPATGAISSSGGGISVTPLSSNIYTLADLGNGTLIAGGNNGKIYRSTNDGSAWDTGTQVASTYGGFIIALESGGGNNALAGTFEDYPFISTNRGQTWIEGEDFNEDAIYGLGFAGGNTVYAGTYGYYHRSDDGGQTWSGSVTATEGNGYYVDFAFPGLNKIVIACNFDGPEPAFAFSSNNGQDWNTTNQGVLDGVNFLKDIASDGDSNVIAGSDIGKVFLSTDSGATWDGGTLLGAATQVISVAYGNGAFYAGTNDNGKIYRSSNAGASWSLYYNPNSINASVNALTVDDAGRVVAAVNNFIVRIPPTSYIYCTPQFSELPVTYPPYFCNTEVNTAGVTDFTDAWNNCGAITEFPCVDTSSGTYFGYAWYDCNGLTSFPPLNVSQGTYFGYTWGSCSGLTTFPLLDVSQGTNFEATWAYCTGLTTFPLLDFSNATVLGDSNNIDYGAWENCENLVSFPAINTSNVEKFDWAWNECYALEAFPVIDTSKGTSFYATWSNCQSLTSFPPLNVSQGTDFIAAWANCNSLTSFPLLDVSSGTNFDYAWSSCTSLVSFPLIDVSSGIYFGQAWQNCTSLTSFPLLDVSQGTAFNNAWRNCSSLTTFPAAMFNSCLATNFTNAWQNCALNQTSVNNILVSLDTAGQSNGTVNINGGTSAAPSGAGATAKTSLQGKSWTVTTN
jgi:hypothetical protein